MSPNGVVRIATRASDLALWQARHVQAELRRHGRDAELVKVTTRGDASRAPIAELGVGVFVKAVQDAVLEGRADVAVHSFKDLPGAPTDGLEIAAVPPRGPVHDVLLIAPHAHDPAAGALALATDARVGTGAVRRTHQLAALRPDVTSVPLRGNVPTRVAKATSGDVDAVLLAAAGLDRLALDVGDLVRVDLEPDAFLPAPAQGALALEIRRGDPLGDALTDLHDVAGFPPVAAERALLTLLDAGCQLPFGAYAVRDGGDVALAAWFEGARVDVRAAGPEAAARAAFDALGAGGAA
ncbi:MAG: hydroxymethylbilane synthase [Trueperaceae bacterium]|nr:hydroxymethylbilane synthase [Trueperaceae bacterium]